MPVPVASSIQTWTQGWLGQFSSDPTLDGYGNPVLQGAQYYNTTLNVIRIFGGTGWANYNPGDSSAAANSANLAQSYASQSANSATQSQASAVSAAASAASVGNAVTLAQNAATQAQASATSASGSATTATTQATNAATSATTASTAATTATTQAASASTSATNASNSATTATTASNSAQTYASNAAASASSASTSATNASTSETNASNSAAQAGTYASNASTSAASASTSAANAATSATQAGNAVNSIITIPLTNTNVTLNATQFSNAIIVFTGNISANIIITTPATTHTFIASNNTTGSFTVTLAMSGGTGTVQVPQGKANSLYSDGSTGIYATSSVAGLQFSGTKTISSSGVSIDASYAGTRTALTTTGMTTTLPLGATLQSGAAVYIDNQTSGTQTIQTNGSDVLDIGSPMTMQPNDKFLFSWDGTEWRTALYSNYISPVFKSGLTVSSGLTSLTGPGPTLVVTNTNNSDGFDLYGTTGANGAIFKMIGNGATTPTKTFQVVGGTMHIVNDAFSANILVLTDGGSLTTTGGINNTAVGNTTASTGAFTTLSATSTVSGTGFTNLFASPPAIGSTTPSTGKFTTLTATSFTGDFTNATLTSRAYLQTSTSNNNTSVGALPAGSGTTAGFASYNNSTPTNSASLVNQITSSAAIINSAINGTGTLLPLTFQMSGTEAGRLSTGGRWLFNTTTDDGTSIVQINGQLHLIQAGAGGGIEFGDGTIQTTANGTTAPVSTVYTPATGSTSITTSGYVPGFIQVYLNGVRLVIGQDYTAADSLHINLTHATGAGDTFEVLTNVIYSPQTVMTPSEVVYTPATGTTTFTVTSYTVGFIDVYLNGSKLVPGTDFTATTGNSITLTTAANGTDQYDVKVASTYTPANALPANNPTLTGGSLTFADGTAQGTASQGRNRIINGSCVYAQRGSFVASANVSGYGGPDRYNAQNILSAGGQFTQSQGTITIGGVAKGAVVHTVNTAISSTTTTNYWGGITQVIEGVNVYDLLGQQVSISFIFNTNVTGTYSLGLADGTGSNSYVTTFSAVANTPARYTFLIPTLSTSLGIPNSVSPGLSVRIGALNTGTYQTSTLNAWQSGNFIVANTQTNWGAATNNFIAMTELQLEQGPTATPFERESIAILVAKCQRYYQTVTPGNLNGMTFTSNGDTRCTIKMSGVMRIAPTVTASNLTLQVIGWGNTVSGTSNVTFINVNLPINTLSSSADSFVINNTTTTNISSSGSMAIWSCSSAPTFFCNAEY